MLPTLLCLLLDPAAATAPDARGTVDAARSPADVALRIELQDRVAAELNAMGIADAVQLRWQRAPKAGANAEVPAPRPPGFSVELEIQGAQLIRRALTVPLAQARRDPQLAALEVAEWAHAGWLESNRPPAAESVNPTADVPAAPPTRLPRWRARVGAGATPTVRDFGPAAWIALAGDFAVTSWFGIGAQLGASPAPVRLEGEAVSPSVWQLDVGGQAWFAAPVASRVELHALAGGGAHVAWSRTHPRADAAGDRSPSNNARTVLPVGWVGLEVAVGLTDRAFLRLGGRVVIPRSAIVIRESGATLASSGRAWFPVTLAFEWRFTPAG